MIQRLQKRYALSEQGAKDLVKGCLACVLQNLSFMFPVSLLYFLVSDLLNGGIASGKSVFYIIVLFNKTVLLINKFKKQYYS